MHSAPSVSYPVGRSAFAGRLLAALGALGLAAAAAWTVQSSSFGWRLALAWGLALGCAGFALRAWWRSPSGVLQWDGGAWQWQDGAGMAPGALECALDLQSRMLLRWQGEGGALRWLWVERKAAPSHWEALRRAVYSRASAPIPAFPRGGKERQPAGKPPAAEQ